MRAVATNTGTGCASAGAGVAVITKVGTRETISFPWNLAAARIIQIDERFEYSLGVMTNEQALSFQEGTYSTTVSFIAAMCP
jgi:hypothetical protein